MEKQKVLEEFIEEQKNILGYQKKELAKHNKWREVFPNERQYEIDYCNERIEKLVPRIELLETFKDYTTLEDELKKQKTVK